MRGPGIGHVVIAAVSVTAGLGIALGLRDASAESDAAAPEPVAVTTTTTPPTTVVTTTTEPPATTTTTTTVAPTTTVPVPEKGTFQVLAVNGFGGEGVAGRLAARLTELGYGEEIATLDGSEPATTTVIFYVDDAESYAARLAEELGFGPEVLRSFDNIPAIDGYALQQVVVYAGPDIESPSQAG